MEVTVSFFLFFWEKSTHNPGDSQLCARQLDKVASWDASSLKFNKDMTSSQPGGVAAFGLVLLLWGALSGRRERCFSCAGVNSTWLSPCLKPVCSIWHSGVNFKRVCVHFFKNLSILCDWNWRPRRSRHSQRQTPASRRRPLSGGKQVGNRGWRT